MTDPSQLDEEVDALYALRPGEFTTARDALAKRLRGEGRRDDAAAVKALTRPTVAAWAVNQLARGEPDWTQALATAGRRLEEAQAALLEHGDRDAWREATAAQREAIDRLARLAERLVRVERGSLKPALRDQIRETLQAATIDPGAREAVAAGRLTRELRPTGTFGAAAGGRARRKERAGHDAAPSDRAAEAAGVERGARAARRSAERDARSALRRAEKDAAAARNAGERAAQAAARARKAHAAAAAALAEAEQAVRKRAEELDAAERAEQGAAAALAEREASLERARAALDALDDGG